MAKHEAVDRLMALATAKRADPTPTVNATPAAGKAGEPSLSADSAVSTGEGIAVSQGPSAAARGRQMFDALRPLLPAVAGAMRLVDHGAVQAVARLLPLLGAPAGDSQGHAAAQADEALTRAHTELQAGQQALRRDLDALHLQHAGFEDRLGRLRTQVERNGAEQQAHDSQLRALGDRVRLLSAGVIILLMLIVAQMILMVVLLHK